MKHVVNSWRRLWDTKNYKNKYVLHMPTRTRSQMVHEPEEEALGDMETRLVAME